MASDVVPTGDQRARVHRRLLPGPGRQLVARRGDDIHRGNRSTVDPGGALDDEKSLIDLCSEQISLLDGCLLCPEPDLAIAIWAIPTVAIPLGCVFELTIIIF